MGRVKFVKGILTHIQKGLNLESTNTQKSYDVLGKFFSAPLPTGKSGNLKTNSGSTSAPPERPIRSRKECFQIVKICGGFRIIPGEVSPPKNAQIEILVAYDIATGNPFKRWCKYDFNFYQLSNGKIEVDSQFKDRRKTNPKIDWKLPTPEESIGNCIVLNNIREKFSFELTGFDPNRDLIVKAELKTKAKMEETPNETQD